MKKSYLTTNNSLKVKKIEHFFFTFLLVIVLFSFNKLNAQAIPASDGGVPCHTCAPPGWIVVTGTPDISDQNVAAAVGTGGGGTAWDAAPLPLPPNGHTDWISLRDLGSSGTEEVISTNMTGLTPGAAYEVTIYTLTATGPYSTSFNDSFTYQVGTNPIISISPITQNVWGTSTFQFVASAATEQLFLRPGSNSVGVSFESVQVSVTLNAIVAVPVEIDVEGNSIPIIGDGSNIPNIADNTDFGQVTSGTNSTEQIFTIYNRGANPLNVFGSFSGNPNFVITTMPLTPVAPGGTTTIGITFNAPVAFGTQIATIFISNNDPDEGAYQINLEAESIAPAPEINVLGNTLSIIGDGTNVPSLTDGTDFGPVTQGTPSVERFFTIQNTGLAPLNLNPSLTTNPIFAVSTPATTPVPAGGSTTIGVTFTAPATPGLSNAILFIANSDADENPYQINLSGTSAVDTDSDGIADIFDIDDDNDGILDTTEGIVDTDGDTIIDALDLDSDNDGIADVVETGGIDADNNGIIDGFIDLDGNGLHDSLDSPELYDQDDAASVITEVNSTTGWSTFGSTVASVSDDSYSGLYAIKSISNAGSYSRSEFSFPVVIGTEYNISIWARRGAQGTDQGFGYFTNLDLTGEPEYNPISGDYEKLLNAGGWQEYTWTLTATANGFATIRCYDSFSAGVAGDEAYFDAISIRESLVQTLQDTDADSISDYLDLDSDNDGCFDALEGAGGFTLSDINGAGNLLAAVDLNGVPGGSLQATTANVTDSSIISAVCDADGDGVAYLKDLDDDNDGVIDTVEGIGDTDGDGVMNSLDLDSDNDGIKDVVEIGEADINGDGIIDGFIDLDSNGFHDPLDSPELYDQDDAASIITEVNSTIGWSTFGSTVASVSDDSYSGLYAIKSISNAGSYSRSEFSFPVVIGTEYNISIWARRGAQGTDQGFGYFTNLDLTGEPEYNAGTGDYEKLLNAGGWQEYTWTLTATATGTAIIRCYDSFSAGVAGDEAYFDAITIRETLVQIVPDNDLDTFVDFLDLDSDNDGIPDNIEAQTTLGYIGPDSVFDANGVDSAYLVGLMPVDTDGDLTPDFLDTDSDNEGADDTTEAGLAPLSGVVGNNGLDTNSETADDYSDVNGVFDDPQNDFPDTDNDITFGGDVDFRDSFADPDSDGDSVPDIGDLDDDNDGITDLDESGGLDPSIDSDGDNIPFYLDDDDANAGIGDVNGVIEAGFDLDGDGIANHLDLDADADGIFDIHEAGHTALDADFNGVIDGVSADFGANGLFNALEDNDTPGATITYTLLSTDTDGIINSLDVDDDGDGVNTIFENPDADANGDPSDAQDTDTDLIPDYLDIDDDGDGVFTAFENPDADSNGDPSDAQDTDTDLIPDYLDVDDDGDGVFTAFENPDADSNGDPSDAQDTDTDLTPDYLDVDDDGDGVNTEFEVDNADSDGDPTTGVVIDTDLDTILNYLDVDDDGDGINTADENPDPNNDGDPTDAEDRDGDLIPNYLDIDSDNDGIPDIEEGLADVDGDLVPNYVDLDSDNDGIYDVIESGQLNGSTILDLGNDGVLDGAPALFGTNGLLDFIENPVDSGILINTTADSDLDGIFDSYELDADNDGCFDVTEAGFTDLDGSGRLASDVGLTVDLNGVVNTPGLPDGYTLPINDLDGNGILDFQEVGLAVQPILTQPIDQVIVINANVSFNVDLQNQITYQWQVSTDGGTTWPTNLADGGTNPTISGATTDILTLTMVPGSYNGNLYRVVLSSPAFACDTNVISAPALLTVYADFDGDGVGDPIDLDDDNDGITDLMEHNGNDPLADVDGDGVPAYLDDNDNNISLGDVNGVVESAYDLDSDGIANHFDLDADGDGVYDTNEAGFADLDLDDNGVIDGLAADFGLNGLFDGVETVPESGIINYTLLNTDGDAQFNFLDIDDDGDSVNTSAENPDPNSNGDPADAQDTDGDGTPDYLDIDDDEDGIYTIFEVPNGDTDGDSISDYLDIDDDGDGVYTEFENPDVDGDGNPSDAQDTDGNGTPDFLDNDDDGDSILTEFENPDANSDGEPLDAQDSDGDLIPDYLDNDDDDDTILTIFENPDPDGDGDPFDAQNTDGGTGDILPDYLDNDDDGDNVLTELENPDPNGDGNPIDAQDSDGDSIPDYLDGDDDNDGIATIDEDVDGDGDPTNDDTDGDGNPNYLDIDDDNDGITTLTEGSENIGDTDGDGFLNYLDQDADDDGISDNVEGQSTEGYILPSGFDANSNGLDDAYEPTPREGINPIDTDGDGDSDYLDSDSDNDWVPDSTEGHDYNADGQPDELPIGDSDGDGLDDAYDGAVGDFSNPNGLINDPATDLPNRDADLESNVFTSSLVVGDIEVDFRDTDDDGDGILTTEEDGNGDGDPTNDNCDSTDASDNDHYPDYLDPTSCDLFPNGFSPNDDGDNDVFIIPALAQFKNFTMDVYDRWGNIVYEYDNNGRQDPIWWDGYSSGTRTISKGQRVPVGTYYFVIKINEGGRQPQTGWVYVNY